MKKFLGATFALALVLGGASGAGAGLGLGNLVLSPTSGPPSSTFEVSGSGCVDQDGGEMSVEVTAPDTVEMTATATPNDAGDWSTTLTVPADAMEGDAIVVNAECIEDFSKQLEQTSFQGFRAPAGNFISEPYSPATFTVTAAPTTTEDTTTTSTTEPDAEVDDADAAAPVVAQPTFTG